MVIIYSIASNDYFVKVFIQNGPLFHDILLISKQADTVTYISAFLSLWQAINQVLKIMFLAFINQKYVPRQPEEPPIIFTL